MNGFLLLLYITFIPSCHFSPSAALPEELPEFTYRSGSDSVHFTNPDKDLLLIIFDTNCSCRRIITYLDGQLDKIQQMEILLLTTDEELFQSPAYYRWKAFRKAQNVEFGIISSELKQKVFGVSAPLHAMIYSKTGHLLKDLGKEVNIRAVVHQSNRTDN